MDVEIHPAAEEELRTLPKAERAAMLNAIAKLEAVGPTLGSPHTSQVMSASVTLRELRPRAGASPWRAFYRQVGNVLRIVAIGPEAEARPRLFNAAVKRAIQRLEDPT
jgi:hypothetical protein